MIGHNSFQKPSLTADRRQRNLRDILVKAKGHDNLFFSYLLKLKLH